MRNFDLTISCVKRSAQRNPGVYVLIFAMQIVAVLCVLFAYGVIYYSYTVFADEKDNENVFFVSYSHDSEPSSNNMAADEFYAVTGEFTEKISDNFNDISCKGYVVGDNTFTMSVCYPAVGKAMTVCINPQLVSEQCPNLLSEDGTTFSINGQNYAVAESSDSYLSAVRFASFDDVPPSSQIKNFYLTLKHQSTYDESEEIKSMLNVLYNMPLEVEAPQSLELLDEQLNNMQILISSLLITFVALSSSLCYRYISTKRKRTINAFYICGADVKECKQIIFSEFMLYSIGAFLVATAFYDGFLKKIFLKLYERCEKAYSLKNYGILFGIYVVVSLVIITSLVGPMIKKFALKRKER